MRNTSKVTTTNNRMAHQALAQAITNSRTGGNAPQRFQRHGRLDRRSLARVGVADSRVFIRKSAPAPDKVRVTILLDASASMKAPANGRYLYEFTSRAQLAAQVGRDLAGATELLPWVTADVVAFTTYQDVVLYPLWESGEDTATMDSYSNVRMAGTEEGYAIAYAYDELQERLQSREQGLIIIVSDGSPGERVHVKSVVDTCRKNGVPVVSVAITESAAQPVMYGKENVVKYDKNSLKLARDMAKVIGRVL